MTEFNPYQAPASVLEDPTIEDPIPSLYKVADPGTRLGAKLLDSLIAVAIVGVSSAVFIPFLPAAQASGENWLRLAIILLVVGGSFIGVLVWNFIWISRYGQTVGKRICKIKIIRTDGTPVSLIRVLGLRWLPLTLMGFIPYVGSFIGLMDCLLIFRKSNQCLHDQIADTIVVKD